MFKLKSALTMGAMTLASPVFAHNHLTGTISATLDTISATVVEVPEIDGSAGLLALAGLATVLLFAWERSRRQQAED